MVLLVVGSGAQDYRADLLHAIADLDVYVVSDSEPTWELDAVRAATRLPRLAEARVGRLSRGLIGAIVDSARLYGAAGIVTFDEHLVEAVSAAASELDLPGLDPRAAALCRNKAATRSTLSAAGVRQPKFLRAVDADRTALDFPVVVKPTTLAGSAGVRLVRKMGDLSEAIAGARDAAGLAATATSFDVLVEQLVDGDEISVDAITERGHTRIAQIARKHITSDGRFIETGHVVDPNDPLWDDRDLFEVIERAHEAVGFNHGISCTEVKLSHEGPVIIEINARTPGDFLPQVAALSGGEHLARVAALVALGADVALRRPTRAAAVRFTSDNASPRQPETATEERVEFHRLSDGSDGFNRTWYSLATAHDGDRAFQLACEALGMEAR